MARKKSHYFRKLLSKTNSSLSMSRWITNQRLCLLLTVIAFGLRAGNLSDIHVEHFDEGVYASNYFATYQDNRFPDQHLYAPPLFPALLDWTLVFSGGSPHVVMWVNVILGTLLVPAVWWTGGLLFDRRAATIAAALVTFSDILIDYSQAALTDIPVTLWIVLAVGAMVKSYTADDSRWALMCAFLTALAWWTKYNGWLPMAIATASMAGWIVFDHPKRDEVFAASRHWLTIVVAAIFFWAPCLYGLQEHGGYAAVAKNHAGYVVGFSGWLSSAVRHFEVDQYVSGNFGVGLLPLFLLSSLIVVAVRFRSEKDVTRQRLQFWIWAAWFLGLTFATPLYRPYPRLILPWLLAAMIGCGAFVEIMFQRWKSLQQRSQIVGITLLVILTVWSGYRCMTKSPTRTGLKIVGSELRKSVFDATRENPSLLSGVDAVVYVLAEPGLFYHLAASNDSNYELIPQPASSLELLDSQQLDTRVPTFIAVGIHEADSRVELAQREDVELVAEFPYSPSNLVLLDDFAPGQVSEHRDQSIQLWRIK